MPQSFKRRLDVFWDGRLVGHYDLLEDGSEAFGYDESYLSGCAPRAISYSLPLRADIYGKRQIRPFFSGLLPEENQRIRLASYLGIPQGDDFSMLEAIGGECAGALSILPHGEIPSSDSNATRLCSENELSAILKSLPLRPMLAGETGLRLSLAGAQSKLPVVVSGDNILLPESGTPSTHILKPELSEWFKGIVHNEHCCMRLAKSIGLDVAETSIKTIGGIPCLVVRRFDRVADTQCGKVRRLHQEDFCQALGRQPERKYQVDGGPLAREIVRLIRSGWSTMPAKDVLAFVDLLVFNIIIGNADAHGKNYSMLYDGDSRCLAPGYDLVSTVFWPALSSSPAMKIGGGDSINSIQSGHWRKFAEELNFGASALRRRIQSLCRSVASETLETLALPSQCADVLDIVKHRAAKILADFAVEGAEEKW